MLATAIFLTHGLQCYVAVDIAWNHYMLPKMDKYAHKTVLEYVVRTFLVVITCESLNSNYSLRYFTSKTHQ
jgi:hypothetical protein